MEEAVTTEVGNMFQYCTTGVENDEYAWKRRLGPWRNLEGLIGRV